MRKKGKRPRGRPRKVLVSTGRPRSDPGGGAVSRVLSNPGKSAGTREVQQLFVGIVLVVLGLLVLLLLVLLL